MEEVSHLIDVLNNAKKAWLAEDALTLKELSNQTIHCATCFQDAGPIAMAVLIYSLSKLIERKEQLHIKEFDSMKKKIASYFELAVSALQQNNQQAFESHLLRARNILTSQSINIKPYIEEVLSKASVNKAGRIYEHGISLGQTAKLLGVTQWELNEYTAQSPSKSEDIKYMHTLTIKERAKMAMEFFE